MADEEHLEEQEMEAEALTAIFDTSFEVLSSTPPLQWAIKLWPVGDGDGGEGEADGESNHVGIRLVAKIPLLYPDDGQQPEFIVEILKGLTEEHAASLTSMADEEAVANAGMPVLYAVCEKLKEWLAENNEKGLDDRSAYAQMIAREKEKEREKQKAAQEYESQKEKEVMTEAEAADLALRKRRAEGTPCTDETFYAWQKKFDAEMKEKDLQDAAASAAESKRGGGKSGADKKEVDKSGRLTGYQQFSDKAGTLNLEAMEAAAENAERDSDEEEDEADDLDGVDEDLFDVDDDDLDDLDFDDDDGDSDEDDQPNI